MERATERGHGLTAACDGRYHPANVSVNAAIPVCSVDVSDDIQSRGYFMKWSRRRSAHGFGARAVLPLGPDALGLRLGPCVGAASVVRRFSAFLCVCLAILAFGVASAEVRPTLSGTWSGGP